MKRILLTMLLVMLTAPQLTLAANSNLRDRLAGYILLQTEEQGQAWYVNPVDRKRYYLRDGNEAYRLMRTFGLGISDSDLQKIPAAGVTNEPLDKDLVDRLLGRIVLQVEQHGEAWYINPRDGLRYYLKDGQAAYELMRQLSLGITNNDLEQIPKTDEQTDFESAFRDISYVKYQGGQYVEDYYGDEVLPPASMTKLMTAIVIAEDYPQWGKKVTITNEILNYPKIWVGNDATSEVNYKVGDQLRVYDLFVALLIASSNQSARALVDSTGLTHSQFLDRMNAKAEELGLTKTVFADVAGLSTDTLTTAKEMARIAEHAFNITAIKSVYAKDSDDFFITDSSGEFRQVNVRDRNYSLKQFQPEAVKTGFLYEAQRTVVLKKGDTIIVVMHAYSNQQRNEVISKLLSSKVKYAQAR